MLVLLDSPSLESSHSAFLAGLRSRGYALEVKPIDDQALQLKSWDDWLYDKLVILGSSKREAVGGPAKLLWLLPAPRRASEAGPALPAPPSVFSR